MWIDNNILTNLSVQQAQLLVVLALWELVWKGIALYKAARNKQDFWFIVLLFINTVGILPILYIRYFQEDKNREIRKERVR